MTLEFISQNNHFDTCGFYITCGFCISELSVLQAHPSLIWERKGSRWPCQFSPASLLWLPPTADRCTQSTVSVDLDVQNGHPEHRPGNRGPWGFPGGGVPPAPVCSSLSGPSGGQRSLREVLTIARWATGATFLLRRWFVCWRVVMVARYMQRKDWRGTLSAEPRGCLLMHEGRGVESDFEALVCYWEPPQMPPKLEWQ